MEAGIFNPAQRVEDAGMIGLGSVHYNLNEAGLMQAAVRKDKFVVREPSVEADVWWENNPPMEPEAFERLHQDMLAHMRGGEYFVQDLYAGADPAHRLNVRLVNELAWHGLFIRHMLRRPEISELAEQEIGVLGAELPPARQGCDANALFGQSCPRRYQRQRRLLRPVGNRQDNAVGRSGAHPAGRRRARLDRSGHLQLRGRLLRQDHQPVARGRARDLQHHLDVRDRGREHGLRSAHA
jgi:hypothetical protein